MRYDAIWQLCTKTKRRKHLVTAHVKVSSEQNINLQLNLNGQRNTKLTMLITGSRYLHMTLHTKAYSMFQRKSHQRTDRYIIQSSVC